MNNRPDRWQAMLDDRSLWHEEAFERYPSIIAHEYYRLYEECRKANPYAMLLQLRDTMEAILKFEVLLICAWADARGDVQFERTTGCQITSRNLSLGSWHALAKEIIGYYKSRPADIPALFINTLSELHSMYSSMQFIKWRNDTIGHGALGFAEDDAFFNDVQQKLKDFVRLFSGKSKKSLTTIGEKLAQHGIFVGELELRGKDMARGLQIADDEPVAYMDTNVQFTLSPYINVRSGSLYLFDNQRKPERSQLLCYPDGSHRDESIARFAQLYRGYESLNTQSGLAVDSRYTTSNESRLLDRLSIDSRFVEPKHLTGWLRAQMDGHDSGVYLICLPRGAGKSCFSEKLNRRYPNPLEIDDDTDARTYHILRAQLRSAQDLELAMENQWRWCHEDDGGVWEDVPQFARLRSSGLSPARAMAEFLNETQAFTEARRGRSRILMVIDGLDEIADDALWNYIPNPDTLAEGVHVLLTSRDPELEKLPREFIHRLEDLNPRITASLSFSQVRDGNAAFLSAMLTGQVGDPQLIRQMIELSGERALNLNMLCKLHESGADIRGLTDQKQISQAYLHRLEQLYGPKGFIALRELIVVLCTLGQYDMLSLDELAHLCGRAAATFELLEKLSDLEPLLHIERGYSGGWGGCVAGKNHYRIAAPEIAEALLACIPEAREQVEKMILEAIDDATAFSRMIGAPDGICNPAFNEYRATPQTNDLVLALSAMIPAAKLFQFPVTDSEIIIGGRVIPAKAIDPVADFIFWAFSPSRSQGDLPDNLGAKYTSRGFGFFDELFSFLPVDWPYNGWRPIIDRGHIVAWDRSE